MKILCLSASNIEPFKASSASTRAYEMIREIILSEKPQDVEVEILPLIDYDLKPCRMCGKCLQTGHWSRCCRDDAFNDVFVQMEGADRLFIVTPQYATIPAKLVILLEKFQEIAYLNWCSDNSYQFPLANKPVGLVAHGGQTEEALPIYKQGLLAPLTTILGSVGMKVMPLDEENPHGAVFGITSLTKPKDSIFVEIEHDWNMIHERIQPLVKNVLSEKV